MYIGSNPRGALRFWIAFARLFISHQMLSGFQGSQTALRILIWMSVSSLRSYCENRGSYSYNLYPNDSANKMAFLQASAARCHFCKSTSVLKSAVPSL